MQNFLNSTTHSISWFLSRHKDDEIELRAPFQRNPVWSEKQKAYLIDSILRGFPIPELYIQEYADADGSEHHVIVDGQQRLRACIEFAQDEYGLDPKDSPEWADMKFSDLSKEDKTKFYNYNFVVRVLPNMPEESLRSMFSRLNRNVVALNPQELRHATYWGEFITTVEQIAENEIWSELAVFTPNDVRRMLDIEFVSELVVGSLHGPQNKKDSLEDWFQTYEKEFPQRREVMSLFNTVLLEITACLPELSKTRWRKKSDFYSLFLFLCEPSVRLPLTREGRQTVHDKLLELGSSVDKYLSNPEAPDLSQNVKRYGRAVERAASDIANRRERGNVLREEISPLS